MSIVEQVELLLSEKKADFQQTQTLQNEYRQLLDAGIIQKKGYNLPPVNVFGVGNTSVASKATLLEHLPY